MREAGDLTWLVQAALWPCLAYLGAGLVLVRALAPDTRGVERLAVAFVLGTGAGSLALLVLRLLDVPVPLAVLAAIAGSTLLVWRGTFANTQPSRGWVRGVDLATLLVAAATFLSALGPETFWDGFEYHLPMVAAWSEGPIRALPGLLDAELRAGVDLLYLPAVAAGMPDAAAAVSACFAACLAALVRAEVLRRATPGAAALAALFTLLVPFTLDNAASSYVDLGVGAYGFLALSAADRWNRGGDRRQLWLAAVCVAFAANAKLHAAVLAPGVLALVCLGGRPIAVGTALRCALVVVLLTLPWLVKVGLAIGNPFFPLLGDWLGTGYASADHLALRRLRLSTDYAPSGPLSLPLYLASLTFGGNPHVSGLLGALPLALLPAALHRPSRPTATLAALLLLLFLAQFAFMPALRFAAPLLPFLAIGAAVGGARLAASGELPRIGVATAIALLLVHHGAAAAATHLPRIAALSSPEAYQTERFPEQMALAELVAEGRGVVAIPKGAVLWMPRPVYLLHWERNGELFFDPVKGRHTPPDEAYALLRRRGVESLVVEVASLPWTPERVGHPTVDTWIVQGKARRRPGVKPRKSLGQRIVVLVDLL